MRKLYVVKRGGESAPGTIDVKNRKENWYRIQEMALVEERGLNIIIELCTEANSSDLGENNFLAAPYKRWFVHYFWLFFFFFLETSIFKM